MPAHGLLNGHMPSCSFPAERAVSHIRVSDLDAARALFQDNPPSIYTAEFPPNTAVVDRWRGRGYDLLFAQPFGSRITAIITDNADCVPLSGRERSQE